MSRKPYARFFWDDWRSEPTLKLCSRAARSFWFDLLGLMHKSGGRLLIAGVRPTPRQIAQVLGDDEAEVRAWLAELETATVFSVDADGVIYSRRMVRDFERDALDVERGRRGGNPVLMGGAASAEEMVTGAAREAVKRARDAERQRRNREKKRAGAVTPERDMSHLSTVTCHVTSSVTERDGERDSPPTTPSAPTVSEPCHGVNPPLKDHSHSHSHRKPSSGPVAPPPRRPAQPPSGGRSAGASSRTKPPDRPDPDETPDERHARVTAELRRLAEAEATAAPPPGSTIQ